MEVVSLEDSAYTPSDAGLSNASDHTSDAIADVEAWIERDRPRIGDSD